MLKFVTLALCLTAVTSKPGTGRCTVGDWSDWSECQSPKSCAGLGESSLRSWSVPAAKMDQGRMRMKYVMEQKKEHYSRIGRCREDGTCPEFNYMPTQGPALCVLGYAGEYPCRNIDQQSFLNFDALGYPYPIPGDHNRHGNDIWGWVDPETGDEYAIMGLTGGTSFVRITDPQNPVTLAFMVSHTGASSWRDIKVIGHYAYSVSEAMDHGMQVFDLHRLRGRDDLQYVTADAHYNLVGNTHNIVSNEETDFVYLVGSDMWFGGYLTCEGGLHAVDVSDPLNPQYAGCYGGDGYVHDAQCVIYRGPDTRYTGREICFCYNEDSFTIVDVTDKSSMTMISKETYDGVQYTHQGWATHDFTTVLLDDELDEQRTWWDKRTKTYLWDIRDLQNPVLKNRYDSVHESIDHNQYVVGNLTYQANYESGLRVLAVDVNPEMNRYELNELAYFDVFPWRTSTEFNGAWSVYPYYPSGNIVVSSIDFGLFVLRPRHNSMMNDLQNSSYGEMTRTRDVTTVGENGQCPAVGETHQCVPDITC